MSYVRVWVHLVFSTKNRETLLKKEIREQIRQHIKENCKEKGIFLQAINGYEDHLHCLISLGCDQTIAKVAQMIKGESSYWINKNKLVPGEFMWQNEYYANSVSESEKRKIESYIRNQEKKHAISG
ncbi:MAG: IS200/IS605 family transposase [Bacteroidia bacterium]|jgi:putative transposase